MAWNEKTKGELWVDGKYSIRLGRNKSAVPSGKTHALTKLDDVYHCYYDGGYIWQAKSLDAAKAACKKHKDEHK